MKSRIITILIVWLLSANAAQAALSGNGNGLVYDSLLNVTWSSDANLFGTMYAADPALVSKIIAAVPMVTDSQGIHGVAASDFRGGGMIDWYGAMAWVGYLNSSRYLGQNTWSLPAADPVCGAAYNCTNSQLGSLFYSSLGGVANTSNIPIHTSYSLFTNIQNGTYWSGTEYAPYTSVASWVFLLGYGYQSAWGKISGIYSWVMLPGNVSTIAAVPEPGEWTMMLAGFGLIGVIARRR